MSFEVTEILGRFVAASNATLLAETADGTRVVYKPVAGERPLWDFTPETLAWREVLAYEVSEALGYGLVPETVMGDGPYGVGSVQVYVDADADFDPVPLINGAAERLWPMAVFDVLVNNADRKIGHILAANGRIVGVDHGLTFHEDGKLRTVLWSFAGQEAPDTVLEGVSRLGAALEGELGVRIEDALGPGSLHALSHRVEAFGTTPVHPEPPTDRPAIPWPPY